MHKCHNYHAILHKLYMWFGKNELRLYLNRAKISSIGGRPPSKYAHASASFRKTVAYLERCNPPRIGLLASRQVDFSTVRLIRIPVRIAPDVLLTLPSTFACSLANCVRFCDQRRSHIHSTIVSHLVYTLLCNHQEYLTTTCSLLSGSKAKFYLARNVTSGHDTTSSAVPNCNRISFSTDASSNASSLSCPIVECSLVFTKDSLEKPLSTDAVVTGSVSRIM